MTTIKEVRDYISKAESVGNVVSRLYKGGWRQVRIVSADNKKVATIDLDSDRLRIDVWCKIQDRCIGDKYIVLKPAQITKIREYLDKTYWPELHY
ncbi:hypothetical protein [Sinomicrobium sp.]